MNVIQEIEIENFYEDDGNTLLLRVFDDNTAYLLFDEFPPDNDKLDDYQLDNLDKILSDLTGVEVTQEDRELFVIHSNDKAVLDKVISFFNKE
jgi:hypothetical protein